MHRLSSSLSLSEGVADSNTDADADWGGVAADAGGADGANGADNADVNRADADGADVDADVDNVDADRDKVVALPNPLSSESGNMIDCGSVLLIQM